jgi:hypothetical protein
MKALQFIKQLLGCLRLGHKPEFIRNVYGDEIRYLGYARSIWCCARCERILFRNQLHREAK